MSVKELADEVNEVNLAISEQVEAIEEIMNKLSSFEFETKEFVLEYLRRIRMQILHLSQLLDTVEDTLSEEGER